MTERGLRIRFVWYLGFDGSKRYDHFEAGLIAHARRNDAVAWYAVREDGTEFHLFDDLLPSALRIAAPDHRKLSTSTANTAEQAHAQQRLFTSARGDERLQVDPR